MAKRVFFSFHYEDVISFRANVVRNHGITKETGQAGFFDASIWEDAELHGDDSVKRLINNGLNNTSVTCVLIGSETWSRRWVRYEILKSYERGNSLIGIHINSIPDKYRYTYLKGPNPFDFLGFYIDNNGNIDNYQVKEGNGWRIYNDLRATRSSFSERFRDRGYTLSEWVPSYDWVADDGFRNFANWIETA